MSPEASTVGGDQSVEELRRELAEAREQQAATAAILAAISNSPTDPYRAFAEIASSAARLCDARNAGIFQLAGDHLRLIGSHGPLPKIGPIGQGALYITRDAWFFQRTSRHRQENDPRRRWPSSRPRRQKSWRLLAHHLGSCSPYLKQSSPRRPVYAGPGLAS